jgi:tRNA-2-methylthio-N6-dimethylallyladenosine synthase
MERLKDDVPEDVKRSRNNQLLSIQARISAEVHRQYIGRTVRVFVESISRKAQRTHDAGRGATLTLGWEKPVTQLTGRTDGDLIVCFDADPALVGTIVEVRIERAAPLALFGRLTGDPVPA